MTREEREELIKHLEYSRSIGADYLITDNDADEIIKALEQEPKIVPIAKIKFDDDMLHEIVEEAIKNIEIEPKWIPISERLPKERGFYIVTEKVFSLDDKEHKGRYNTMVEQVEYCNDKWQRAKFFEVVAWMPLPKPYKESEDK